MHDVDLGHVRDASRETVACVGAENSADRSTLAARIATHAVDAFDVTPYLVVTSPEKRCGKTRLLEVLEGLVRKPWRATGLSEAVLFRKIACDGPTLLLDEVDAVFAKKSEDTQGLRGLLNAERMRLGLKAWRERAQKREWKTEAVAGLDAVQLRGIIERRHWETMMLALAGLSLQEIAVAMGYSQRGQVARVLKRPEIVRMMDLIREAQVERVIRGEFGARGAAQAAASEVMAETIKVARGEHPTARVSDQLRAGETVLKVSGELGGGKDATVTHHHLHALIKDLTPQELRHLGQTGEWPERYREQVARLRIAHAAPKDPEP